MSLLRLPLLRRLLLLPRSRSLLGKMTLTQTTRTGHIAIRQSSITTGMTYAQLPLSLTAIWAARLAFEELVTDV
jgi:hypothetical protein